LDSKRYDRKLSRSLRFKNIFFFETVVLIFNLHQTRNGTRQIYIILNENKKYRLLHTSGNGNAICYKILSMKNIQNLLYTGMILTTVLTACHSAGKGNLQNLQKGCVTAKVCCAADTSVNYSLYIPSGYDPGREWPLIIAFDPHAAGLIPVSLFKDEAEKRGFLVAASNNSKNGMDFGESTAIYHTMLDDIKSRFSTDTGRIYTVGFSGGARVAGMLAMTEGNIAGVVSCGAGLPSSGRPPQKPFSFLGVAGTEDFNYPELLSLDPQLEQAGFTHYLLTFEGKHEWPPKELVPDIMTWLEFDAMRTSHLPVDRNAINRFIDRNDSLDNTFATAGKSYERWQAYEKMQHYLRGLTDVSSLENILATLAQDTKVIERKKQMEDQLMLEDNLRKLYSEKLQNPDLNYWQAESAKLRRLSARQPPDDVTVVYKRILGFLSLSSYMYSNNALKQNLPDAAGIYIEIYRLVDPENPEHRYMAAVAAARKGDKEAAFGYLNKAVESGFKEKSRLLSDQDFTEYHSDPRFRALLKRF